MATIVISHASSSMAGLLETIVELRGDTAVTHKPPETPNVTCDALIADLAWEPGLALAQQLHTLDSKLAIICLSSHPMTPAARALQPTASIIIPFEVSQVSAALDAALTTPPTPPLRRP